MSLRTDDEEHPEWLPRVLDLGQEVRREAERERDLRRLVEVRLQDAPNKGDLRVSERSKRQRRRGKGRERDTHLLKIMKLSSTCSSCLFVTVRRILSCSSSSVSGICVRRRW